MIRGVSPRGVARGVSPSPTNAGISRNLPNVGRVFEFSSNNIHIKVRSVFAGVAMATGDTLGDAAPITPLWLS